MDLRYRIVETDAGFAALLVSDTGLRNITIPTATRDAAEQSITRDVPAAREDDSAAPDLANRLIAFFAGERVSFADVAFDWSGCSEFEQAVWRACNAVDYGERRSYRDLAVAIGKPKAARAVGMAMSHNPCPIVTPCHRIVRSDGGLGGYSGPGGLDFKQQLLAMESGADAVS